MIEMGLGEGRLAKKGGWMDREGGKRKQKREQLNE